MEYFGSVFNARNICFKSTNGAKKTTLDHAYKTGRPCLIIAENEEYMYFLTIEHSYNDGRKYKHLFEFGNKYFNKSSSINVRDIYKKKIYGFQELEYIDKKDMLRLLDFFIDYQVNEKEDEYFREILPIIRGNITKDKLKKYKL